MEGRRGRACFAGDCWTEMEIRRDVRKADRQIRTMRVFGITCYA